MNLLTTTAARVLFSVPFIVFGVMHFINANAMAGMVPVPGGVFWIYLTGLFNISGGISAITGFKGKLAMYLLALLLLIYIVSIHIPGMLNPQTAQFAISGLLKDAGLMGGALLLAGIFSAKEEKSAERA